MLAVLAYSAAFQVSFIADDFPQIQISRTIAEPGGFDRLFANPGERLRITFFVLTYWVDRAFGFDPRKFHGVAVAIHVLCCWLLYALGSWRLVGRKVALIAACFFAVYEGHQEAVMWYSAIMEMLLFLFGMASLAAFIHWLQGKGWIYYALSIAAFVLGIFSGESAYIIAVLMVLPVVESREWRRGVLGLLPFVAVAACAIVWLAGSGVGGFAITTHFPRVIVESFGRLLFVWGLLALAALAIFRAREYLRLTAYSIAWIILSLIPYSFLTYLDRVPSRHTYLASAGLSLVVAAAMVCVWERLGGRLVLAIGAIILMVNVTFLWRKEAEQYQTRALPTDMLINAVRHADGPIHIRCYPYNSLVAESAAREFGGTVVFEPETRPNSNGRCMNFWYKDAIGSVREVFVPPARLP